MLKLLIFSGTPLSDKNPILGGWILGLLDSFKKYKSEVEVSVSYISNSPCFEKERDGMKLYPLVKNNEISHKIKRYLYPKSDEEYMLSQMLSVIEKCQPDIIQIFGTESVFGLIVSRTDVPVVIHLQGLMNAYINAWFPPNYSICDLNINERRNYLVSKYYAKRESKIFQGCKYYLGRTEWDKRISRIYAPDSVYFHCDELLRSEFYEAQYNQKISCGDVIQLTSVLSSPLYKGHDVILKTAYLLKERLNIPFEWNIYGNFTKKAEEKTRLKADDLNVRFMGRVNFLGLIERLQQTDIFVHPSYIDNSPNSVCEAQYMGVPIIACNVGGLSSLIEHEKNGILVPANGPYLIASYIKELRDDNLLYEKISFNARHTAMKRHSRVEVVENLIKTYNIILENNYNKFM